MTTTDPTLADLERRAADRRDQPAYGHDALITCDRLVRIFSTDGVEVQALQGLDLLVREGELMALVGASGSGKSTLMNILAGLDEPTAGAAKVAGCDLLTMGAKERLRYRRDIVGFVWQQTARNLLPYLTAAQNVALPMQLRGGTKRSHKSRRAVELLDLLGVGDCRDRRPQALSGGQQQRVAIAVALANEPSVLLADEPTGELDSHTGEQIFAAFRTANEELGTTIVIVTHDQAVASEVRRTVAIRDGRTSTEVLRRTQVDAATGQESLISREYAMLDRAGGSSSPRTTRGRWGCGTGCSWSWRRTTSGCGRTTPSRADPDPYREAGVRRGRSDGRHGEAGDPVAAPQRHGAVGRAQPQPRAAAEKVERVPAEESERLGRVGGPHRNPGVADGPRPDLAPGPVQFGARARIGSQLVDPRLELGDRGAYEPAYDVHVREAGNQLPAAARGRTPAHGGPVTAAGTRALPARSSIDSSSSPADTVTSSELSSPYSYGFRRRAVRIASTSNDGGRPKTASACPPAWSRTAAARS